MGHRIHQRLHERCHELQSCHGRCAIRRSKYIKAQLQFQSIYSNVFIEGISVQALYTPPYDKRAHWTLDHGTFAHVEGAPVV